MPPDGRRPRLPDALVGMCLGVALVGLIFYWALQHFDAITLSNAVRLPRRPGQGRRDRPLFLDWVGADRDHWLPLPARRCDISTSYAQSLRLMVKNAVLWVMFLSSMAASVFFSFDSHFNAIFPAEARARAAEIRTTSQIGSSIADIGALAQRRQLEEAERLFDTAGWKAYDNQLVRLSRLAQDSQGEIERYFVAQMEERRRAINEQQERIATSHSGQAGLASKKLSLTDELSRLKLPSDRGLPPSMPSTEANLDAKAKEIDAKRIESMAENRGVEGSMKQGRGPVYRQRMSELALFNDQYKIKEERTKDAYRRLNGIDTRLTQVERELSGIDGDLAKFKGETETAEQRIKATLAAGSGKRTASSIRRACCRRSSARGPASASSPRRRRLAALQQQCSNLIGAMSSTEATKGKLRGIDCDPKQAAEAAGRVFALNTGIAAFQARCAGGDKLNGLTSTDALLGFGATAYKNPG